MSSIFLPFRRYARFSGRSGRAEYWMFTLFTCLAYLACYVLIGVGVAMESTLLQSLGSIVLLLVALVCLVPMLAVTVRRLHDIDKSEWFVLLLLVPLGALVVLVMMALPGTQGGNRFGPPDVASENGG